jgi:hypothetical protein
MAHGGQIHQQTIGEPGHGRVAEGMYLCEQGVLRRLQAAWLEHGTVEFSQASDGFAKRGVVAEAQRIRSFRDPGASP